MKRGDWWLVLGLMAGVLLIVRIVSIIPQAYREWHKEFNEPKIQVAGGSSKGTGNVGEVVSFTNSQKLDTNWFSVSNDDFWKGQTNFLTIYLSNHVMIYPPGNHSYALIQFTDDEWNLITNYYTDRETNIQTFKFYGDIKKSP